MLVYYASRKLSTTERNFRQQRGKPWEWFITLISFGTTSWGKNFTFHVDHSALLYLVSKQELTGKLARWTLLL